MDEQERDERREIRQDLEATVEARRELGPAYEDELVQGFVERLDQAVQQRLDERLAHDRRDTHEGGDDDRGPHFPLGITSLWAGIPITAIAGGQEGLAGIAVAWLGIVGVNAAYALGRRRRG